MLWIGLLQRNLTLKKDFNKIQLLKIDAQLNPGRLSDLKDREKEILKRIKLIQMKKAAIIGSSAAAVAGGTTLAYYYMKKRKEAKKEIKEDKSMNNTTNYLQFLSEANNGKWIQKAIKKSGSLHKQLGIPQDKKIPTSKLAVKPGDSLKLKKRKILAQTLKKISRKKRLGESLTVNEQKLLNAIIKVKNRS